MGCLDNRFRSALLEGAAGDAKLKAIMGRKVTDARTATSHNPCGRQQFRDASGSGA